MAGSAFPGSGLVALWLIAEFLGVCAGAPAAGCRVLPRGTCAVRVQVRFWGGTSRKGFLTLLQKAKLLSQLCARLNGRLGTKWHPSCS